MPIMSDDHKALQRAVAKALEKEAKANGTWVDPNAPVKTYIALFGGPWNLPSIRSTNKAQFDAEVANVKKHYPNIQIRLLTRIVQHDFPTKE